MIRLIKNIFYNEKETKKMVSRFVASANKLSFGGECIKFEKQLAKYQGCRDCVFVNSGSSANLALIQSLLNLGILKKGDYVGISSVTWSTNAMPLL